MRQLLILLLCLSCSQLLTATPDPNLAGHYQTLAETAAKNDQLDSAQIFLAKATTKYQDQDSLIRWIKAHKTIGRIFRDEHHKPEIAVDFFMQATELWREPRTDKEWEELAWLYVNIGYTYNYRLSQLQPAAHYYELGNDIMSNRLKVQDDYVAEYILQVLGNLNTKLGDFAAAEVYLEQFKTVCLAIGDNNLAAEAYSDLSILYKTTQRYEASIESYKQGLQLSDLSYVSRGLLEGNLAETLADTRSYQEALRYSKKARASFVKSKELYDYQNADSYIANLLDLEGKIHTEQKAYTEAEQKFSAALNLFEQLGPTTINRDAGKLYISWGKLYLAENKSTKALDRFQKALQEVITDFDNPDPKVNPTLQQVYQENTIMEALDGKILAFSQAYTKTEDAEMLRHALACHDLLYEIEKQFRQSYHYESSKLFSLESGRLTSEHALIAALQLWEATKDPRHQEKAFAIAEKNKSILLLEAFQKSKAAVVAGVPSAIQTEEKTLQKTIAQKEKEVFSAKSGNQPDTTIQKLEMELLTLRQNYTDWRKQIEEDYPQYYNLKYKFEPASLEEIRNSLAQNEALLEYFVGKENIYAFVLTQRHLKTLMLPKDFPLEEWVLQFRQDIEAFQFPNTNRMALCETYTKLAVQLHDKLVAPIKREIGLPQKLTIIPSGILGYLPFDALLSEKPAQLCHFENYPYLLYDHDINYGYSATLQATLSNLKGINKKFAGFGPKFSGDQQFGALEQNISSLQEIGQMIDGQLFLENRASLDQFLAHAEQFGILQLATHAKANTEEGDFSYVVFSDGNGGYDSLFVKDVYLLDLAAELVVLSACETAVGTVYSSEGIISLARSFLYSGAKSIITTLWSINENTNLKIVENFYRELKDGHSKSTALRLAKVKQIEESDRFHAHPVYWAALAPIGDSRAIFGTTWLLMSGLGAIGLAFLAGVILWFRKKFLAPKTIQLAS